MKKNVMQKKPRLLAIVALMALCLGLGLPSAMAGAQEQTNPWWLNRYPVASDLADQVQILEVRPNGRVSFEFPLSRFYGLAEHGMFVIAGEDLLSLCAWEYSPRGYELITYRAGGKFVTRTPVGGVELPTYVYDTGGMEGLSWAFMACDAWDADGTPPPTPMATGFTTLRIRSNPDVPLWSAGDQPPGFYRNGLTGQVTDADGAVYDLRTFASFPLTGEEQGPPDFVRHEVSLTAAAG